MEVDTNLPSKEAISSYYDQDIDRALRDYVHGNPRIHAAIERCLAFIGPSSQSLLDIGCGIGQSSFTFRRERPWLNVLGIDISSRRIECARRLFGEEKLRFEVSDMSSRPAASLFHVVTMLDVYEHVPPSARQSFHDTLARCLSDEGTVVMTFPSTLHQNYLRRQRPEELQVVDETVFLSDISNLATDLQGELVLFEFVSIWNTNDYVHAVITRNPAYGPIERNSAARSRFSSLLSRVRRGLWDRRREAISREIRRKKVRDRLNISVR